MEQFFYTYKEKHTRPYKTAIFVVYVIRNNQPRWVGQFSASRGSWMGEEAEIKAFIQKKRNKTSKFNFVRVL
jgi:hypothetical protein